MLDSVEDGGLGNLVEDDTRSLFLIESEHLTEVPADGFSFAILIGCEPHFLGGLGIFLEFCYNLLLILWYLIVWFKRLFVDTESTLLQVSDVSVGRHHFIILAEELLNGFGLGRALYND